MILTVCSDCSRVLKIKTMLRESKIKSSVFLKDGKVVSDGDVFFELERNEVVYSHCDPCKKKAEEDVKLFNVLKEVIS